MLHSPVRDIRQKYKIRNPILMNRIVDFLMANISNLTSARNIADALTGNKDKICLLSTSAAVFTMIQRRYA